MKFFKYAAVLFIAITFLFTACHKDNNSGIQLTGADIGKVLSLSAGQKFTVTLNNPGDGGYTFNTWRYDTTILQLVSHVHNSPPIAETGNYGNDSWQFTALKSGLTGLQITASQSPIISIVMFSNTVKVQ